jgi:hypothetical protein
MTDFAAKASRFTGKLRVGGGPVPIQRWSDKDRKSAHEDLRGEERSNPHPRENGSARPKGGQ